MARKKKVLFKELNCVVEPIMADIGNKFSLVHYHLFTLWGSMHCLGATKYQHFKVGNMKTRQALN